MDYKKLIENMLAQSQMTELPEELQPATFHIWEGDIDVTKDWDDFITGQLTNHTKYKETFKAGVDNFSLEYGSNATSFYSLFGSNTTIEIYTHEYIDITGKFVTIGDQHDKKFFALSYKLDNFKLKDKKQKPFMCKIILVDLVKYISEQVDDDNIAPTINIENGRLGETITIPTIKAQNEKETHDANIEEWELVKVKVGRVKAIELLLDKPAIIAPPDIIKSENFSVLTDKKVIPTKANTKPKKYPENPYYSILPTQFNIFALDNYGFTHPADPSNVAKVIGATQSLGSSANTGLSIGGALGLGGKASTIGTAVIGLAGKFFGDKGTLANSGAIVPKFVKSDSDGIKLFIQGDAATSGGKLDENGYLDLAGLKAQRDYMEINQANGEFGKYGKSMSPSQNSGFNSTTIYRALGIQQLKLQADRIPALATPFVTPEYSGLKITDDKIQDYLKFGSPRLEAFTGEVLSPLLTPETWPVYIRNMFFRPDPYSFWNFPMLMAAEIGAYNVQNETSIAYDITSAAYDIVSGLGTLNDIDNKDQIKKSYWNKTITLDQLSNNDLYDPNKTFISLRYEFTEDDFDKLENGIGQKTEPQILHQLQMFGFYDGIIQVKLLDENDEVIREHKFNSQGKNVGSPASPLTVVQF